MSEAVSEESKYHQAFQIVSINELGTDFKLDEATFRDIVDQVPKDMKVAIVSIVGAFRTGKSFILDLFLRYLRYQELHTEEISSEFNEGISTSWIYTGATGKQSKLEGNSNDIPALSGAQGEGFSWRAGKDRNTTGIWLWGTPFIRKIEDTQEDVAVFLMDTQGMFDSETSQMLTASIFGLSTLMSSYQIYNVDKKIQEDNLQHLALFTEYGRMALAGTKVEEDVDDSPEPTTGVSDEEVVEIRPFQRLEFLVRDWQNFTDENDDLQMMADMEEYLIEILATRKQQDLADTREQINSCFEELTCWLLPHPGFEVIKKNYDGNVEKIRPEFLRLITRYVQRLFSESILPKKIHGRCITGMELCNYVKAYVQLFREHDIFPEATTLLQATAMANNINSKQRALDKYKKEMNKIAGLKSSYIPKAQFDETHELYYDASVELFNHLANMGKRSEIQSTLKALKNELEIERLRYAALNHEKNPYKNIEMYVIPFMIWLFLFTFRILQDLMCYESIGIDIPVYDCKEVSTTLSHLAWGIFTFTVLMALTTGHVFYDQMKRTARMGQILLGYQQKEKND